MWYEGIIMWYPPVHIIFYSCWFLLHYFNILYGANLTLKHVFISALTASLVLISASFFWELGILYRNNMAHYNTTSILVYFIPLQLFYLSCFALALNLGQIKIFKNYNILLLLLSFSFTILVGIQESTEFGILVRVMWNISLLIMFGNRKPS